MAFDVIFSLRAERQIQAIYRFVAMESGPERADKFVDSIVEYCLRLDLFPDRGTRRDDISPSMKIFGFKRTASIAVRVEGDRVVIHGIFYGRQDFEAALRDDVQ